MKINRLNLRISLFKKIRINNRAAMNMLITPQFHGANLKTIKTTTAAINR
jgi:hypothetical protein